MANIGEQITYIVGNYWYLFLILGIIIYVLILFAGRKKSATEFKDFKPVPSDKMLGEELKGKFDLQGTDLRSGKLYIGFQRIAHINRYFIAKGKFDTNYWDPKNKEFVIGKEDEQEIYEMLFIEAKSLNPIVRWLFNWLGVGRFFFLLKLHDEKGNLLIRYDPLNESLFLNVGMDLTRYAKIWTNCSSGSEYLGNLSIKKMSEKAMMHVENAPDKFAHLEMEQAKKERTNRVLVDLEKSKYKERESAGDTTIV
jgi:hypothetical protein